MNFLKLTTLLLLIFASYLLQAQGNAAEFDGTTGYIEVEGASQYITDDGITMEAWVFPRNVAPGFPDFDGILGVRNDTNCDFYMLQLSATDVESRFRNSDGQDFTIASGGLVVNEWNHLALSYGNGTLTYYVNGQFQASMPATGLCGDESLPFHMGKLDYQSNPFFYDGLLDEVRFWYVERTEDEIAEFYNCQIGTPEDFPTLGYYYKLDEETGSTTATDSGDSGVTGNVVEGVTFVESTVDYKVVNSNEDLETLSLNIYPNPSSNSVSIDVQEIEVISLELYDISGSKINVNYNLTNGIYNIDKLSKGTYFVTIQGKNQTMSRKFVVL